MNVVDTVKNAAFASAIQAALNYMDKDPETNIPKVMSIVDKAAPEGWYESQRNAIRQGIAEKGNWYQLAQKVWELDPGVRKTFFTNFIVNASLKGSALQKETEEKEDCNVPWAILLDPTSACNLHCTGCWAAEYGHKLNLSLETIDDIVTQGKKLGTYMYIYTGGEPMVRKKDIITICERHPDCEFLSFTNGTLIDEEFCQEMLRVKNFVPAISLEGFAEVNDLRRGEGVYGKVMHAMDLLKQNGLVFGTSICYTSKNIETVTSDEFVDLMIEKGCRYALYFHYMPVGNDASVDLLPAPEQRIYMRSRVREIRNMTTGKGLFTMDFQNDGEFVGGCIAGGRNYFHINANGDAEPCVFIHYSGANIRKNTLLEILKQPLFMAYYNNQPFNENHLRPCPMLENPEILQRIVKESGAKSTDLQSPESAEHLCEKCEAYAKNWKPCADKLWAETKMPQHSYKNYKK